METELDPEYLPQCEADAEELVERLAERVSDLVTFAKLQRLTAPAGEREPAPTFVTTRTIADRQAALSRVLAALATRDPGVVAFRRDVLGGRLLTHEEVGPWIQQQAEADGPAAVWVSVLLPPGVRPRLGERLTVTLNRAHGVEIPVLCYTVPSDRWVRTIPVAAEGVLGQLQQLSQRLSRHYGWHEAAATVFVLTGATPYATALRITTRMRPDLPALGRFVLEIDPVLTPAEVAARYRRVRSEALGKERVRPQSPKHLALAVFAVECPDGTLRQRMALWNERYPEWRYQHVTNFGRDLKAAVQRLLKTPGVQFRATDEHVSPP